MSELINRTDVRAVACPNCGAEEGEFCRGVERRDGSSRDRTANHTERIAAWQAMARTQAARTLRPYDVHTKPLPPKAPPEERARVHAQLAELRAKKGWPTPTPAEEAS